MIRVIHDLVRVLVLLVVVGWWLHWMDPANDVVYQALGIAIFMVGGTHLTRRVLMPRLDLQLIALEAVKEKNWPAAIVFAVVVYFLVAIIQVSLAVLK